MLITLKNNQKIIKIQHGNSGFFCHFIMKDDHIYESSYPTNRYEHDSEDCPNPECVLRKVMES
jgi:hypothetical protein